ncbi:MAG: Cyclopropane-fatty-acyl-phospholipid synthase [Deltaproteobacteria bacterium]|nr:Cyclopropane-fatty-acyl-phospholipid synthase [Deltaproteobacteria bacterium]
MPGQAFSPASEMLVPRVQRSALALQLITTTTIRWSSGSYGWMNRWFAGRGAKSKARLHLPQAASAAGYALARYGLRLGRPDHSCGDALRCGGGGIDVSPEQAEVARQRIRTAGMDAKCRVEMEDFFAWHEPEGFDRVSSVGAAEHVPESRFEDYFRLAFASLRPGGQFLHHAITRTPSIPERPGRSFNHRYVFPDHFLATIGQTLSAALRARKPKKLVGVVAVASAEAARAMLRECDAMVCLNVPAEFYAVGQFFDDFSQVSDDDVVAILKQDVEKASAVG